MLHLLRQSPEGIDVSDLAQGSALHPNTVRFHLNRLVAAGLARREVQPAGRPGRPRLTFAPTDVPGDDRDRRNYQLLAGMLAGFVAETASAPGREATQLGRSWGRYLATRPAPGQRVTEDQAVGELLRVLDDVGFAPQATHDALGHSEIRLRHCPFREVATAQPDVVCSLHLGLMQGVVAEQGAPVDTTDLQPWVEPSLCIAHLRNRELAHSSGSGTA